MLIDYIEHFGISSLQQCLQYDPLSGLRVWHTLQGTNNVSNGGKVAEGTKDKRVGRWQMRERESYIEIEGSRATN